MAILPVHFSEMSHDAMGPKLNFPMTARWQKFFGTCLNYACFSLESIIQIIQILVIVQKESVTFDNLLIKYFSQNEPKIEFFDERSAEILIFELLSFMPVFLWNQLQIIQILVRGQKESLAVDNFLNKYFCQNKPKIEFFDDRAVAEIAPSASFSVESIANQ